MDELRKQWENVTYSAFVTAASLYFWLYYTWPIIHDFSERATLLGLSWNVIPLSFAYAYKHSFWKAFNPKLNFDGYWDFTEEQYEWTLNNKEKFIYSAAGQMRVEQTAQTVRIGDGQTRRLEGMPAQPKEISSWRSLACDISSGGQQISAALDHQSSPHREGGAVQYGVEIMSVTKRNQRGKPVEMSSKVYHCVGFGKPRIVTVHYVRRMRTA